MISEASESNLLIVNTESARQQKLRALEILDSGPEPAYDAISDLASKVAHAPVASVTFFDQNRVWFKAIQGSDLTELPREDALCSRLYGQPDGPLIIPDTLECDASANLPIVRDDPKVRAYLGAPLLTTEGIAIGSICTLDVVPRQYTDQEIAGVQQLAALAMAQLQLREMVRELEQAQADGRAASRAKDAFLANMSHEIRTPMNGVLGLASLLKTTALSENQDRYVDGIENCATNLMSLLSDILEYSDLLNDRTTVNLQPVDLHELAREVDGLVRPAISQRGLRLTTVASHAIDRPVIADRLRLRQVLLQLLENATKFTLEGSIELQFKRHGDQVRISVRDTGIGIPHEMLDRIQLPFTQVHESADRPYPGKGLGLSTVSEVLRLKGTRLCVESVEGRGSTFWFDLPAAGLK
jgi:signal transduction histidine kinase